MAELATVARPYAEAAFQLAKVEEPQNWLNFFQLFSIAVSDPAVAEFVQNPAISDNEINQLLIEVTNSRTASTNSAVNDQTQKEQQRFIEMLVKARRLLLLPEIAKQLQLLINEHNQIADAEIRSAYDLPANELDELLVTLEKKFATKLRAKVTIDRSLIGGFSVKVKDKVFDCSVKAKLAQLKDSLVI